MTASAAPVRARGGGSWRPLVIGLIVFVFARQMPQLRVILPIEQTILLLVPFVAVCLVIGWRQGGNPWIALGAVALSVLLLLESAGPPGSSYSSMARGWALLLAASFGLVSIVAPTGRFFPRALAALALATSIGFSLVLLSSGGPSRVGSSIASELNRRNDISLSALRETQSSPRVSQSIANSPTMRWIYEENERQLAAIPDWAALLLPALLGIESLIAMALGWSLHQRISPTPIGAPLGRLRNFRFNDQLVWGVAVGASIYLLPSFRDGRNAGLNLLVFFGALYILRGLGVMAWMAEGRIATRWLVAIGLLAFPFAGFLGAIAFGLGLGDTWLDWRTRPEAKPL